MKCNLYPTKTTAVSRRSPFHLVDGLQLAERQLQDLDDAVSRGGENDGASDVATALKVLLRLGGWQWIFQMG